MVKVTSCGIVPIRNNNGHIEILLGQPINGGFYGMGFLKGQVENNETDLNAALREFAEESGDLDIELIDKELFFTQNNPKKLIHIWPATVLDTDHNKSKIRNDGVVEYHDDENDYIQFFDIDDLPMIFRNQQDILNELLIYIKKNKDKF